MIMNLHTHTHHSPDAQHTVAERVSAANQLGLRFMAVTDHVEINRYYPASYYHAEESEEYFYDGGGVFARSAAEITAAQANCGPLTLLCGSEVGQIPQDVEKAISSLISFSIFIDPLGRMEKPELLLYYLIMFCLLMVTESGSEKTL